MFRSASRRVAWHTLRRCADTEGIAKDQRNGQNKGRAPTVQRQGDEIAGCAKGY